MIPETEKGSTRSPSVENFGRGYGPVIRQTMNGHTELFTKTDVLFHPILPPLLKQQHGDEYEHKALTEY
jgi:hypothetical protein